MKVRTEQQVIHRVRLELDDFELNQLTNELDALREFWVQRQRMTDDTANTADFLAAYPKIMELWKGLWT